jgi:aspartyl protease family protein
MVKTAVIRELMLWTLCAIAGFLLVFYYDEIRQKIYAFQEVARRSDLEHHIREPESKSKSWENIIVIHANREGHFATRARINNEDTMLMVDTGATFVALSYETAEEIGLNIQPGDFTKAARTANGISKVASVNLDEITIGDITVTNVDAIVVEPGKLDINLLGMNFLSKLKRFEVSGRKLLLVQ